jgi:hypothetical protein
MLLTIGGRYLTFSTLYGLRIYYFCGAALSIAAVAAVLFKMPFQIGAMVGALVEYIFGFLVFLKARRESRLAV